MYAGTSRLVLILFLAVEWEKVKSYLELFSGFCYHDWMGNFSTDFDN